MRIKMNSINRYITFLFLFLIFSLADNSADAQTATPTYSPTATATPYAFSGSCGQWGYFQTLTIDKTKVSSTDQSDFPVYIDLSLMSSGFFIHAKSDGGDIRATSSDGSTEYPIDLVAYSNSGTGQIWVKIPTVSASTDTSFRIYYGNASATAYAPTAAFGGRAVWSNSYGLVSHQESVSSVFDSSGTLTATNTGATNATGKIGGATSFGGGGNLQNWGTSTRFAPAELTLSLWLKATSFSGAYNAISDKGNGSTAYSVDPLIRSNGKLAFYVMDSLGNQRSYDGTGSNTLSTGVWYYLAFSYKASGSLIGYVNGSQDGTASATSSGASSALGMSFLVGNSSFGGRGLNGIIDEYRISSTQRTAGWLLTEYNNQSNPGAFIKTFSSESSNSCPTSTPTQTSTATSTPTNTSTDTATATATNTPTRTPTNTATPTPIPTATPTNTATNTPSSTATQANTVTNTPTNTPTPTYTWTETATSTVTATVLYTATPTFNYARHRRLTEEEMPQNKLRRL